MTVARLLVVEEGPVGSGALTDSLAGGLFQVIPASHDEAWGRLEGGEAVDLVLLGPQSSESAALSALRRLAEYARRASWPVLWQPLPESPSLIQAGLAIVGHYHVSSSLPPEGVRQVAATAWADRQARQALEHYFIQGSGVPLPESLRFSIRTLEEAQTLADFLAPLCPAPELATMGLTELLVNGIEHGNLGIDFAEKTRLKEVDGWQQEVERRLALPEHCAKRVSLTLTQTPEHWIFLIEDEGPGFDWRGFLQMQPERACAPNGRGIALAHLLAFSDLEYQGSGARVRIAVRRTV